MDIFETTPYQHQLNVWEKSWQAPYWGLLLDMGTGKSKVLLDTIAALADVRRISGALIVAPKGVYRNWETQEIPKHFCSRIPRRVLVWEPAQTIAREQVRQRFLLHEGGFPILIMNVEALSTSRGTRYAEQFLKAHCCLFAIDESSTIKNPSSARTKAAIALARWAPYRRILTGSPVTKSPLDVYAQARFLSPKAIGFNSIYAFRNHYAVTEKDFVTGTDGRRREFTNIVSYRRLDELHEVLQTFSTRILKADCLDLPEKVYTTRHVPLSDQQRTLYESMLQECIAEIEGCALPSIATVVITQILRLHQIVCGHLVTIDGKTVPIEHGRITALMELLRECSGKAIIWANYRHNLREIEAAIGKEYGAGSFVTYSGETAGKDRPDAVAQFQDMASPVRFFIGQPRTGGYGLTLTAATTVIYYANSYDLEVRMQSEDRAHRIGQKSSVTYVDLLTPGTIDEKIVTALNTKAGLAAKVLGEQWRKLLLA